MNGLRFVFSIVVVGCFPHADGQTTCAGGCGSAPPMSTTARRTYEYAARCAEDSRVEAKPSRRRSLRSRAMCAAECSDDRWCVGYNFLSGERICEIFNHTTSTDCSLAVSAAGGRYFDKVNFCLNGGTYAGGRCNCVPGWLGIVCERRPIDCTELYGTGVRAAAVTRWFIHPAGFVAPILAHCRLAWQFGGSTYIQRNMNVSCRTSFNRTWAEYRDGFAGRDKNGADCGDSFWMGNADIHRLAGQASYSLLVELIYADYVPYGHIEVLPFRSFSMADEASGFRVGVAPFPAFVGVLVDSLTASGRSSIDGRPFSTFDRDQDGSLEVNCAAVYGGGWFYNGACAAANVNGRALDVGAIFTGQPSALHWNPTDRRVLYGIGFSIYRQT